MPKLVLELGNILTVCNYPLRGEIEQAAQLLLERETGRTDPIEIGHIHDISAPTGIFDQNFRDPNNGGNRCAKFLAHEGCNNTLEALVRISHVASESLGRARRKFIFSSRRGISIGFVS